MNLQEDEEISFKGDSIGRIELDQSDSAATEEVAESADADLRGKEHEVIQFIYQELQALKKHNIELTEQLKIEKLTPLVPDEDPDDGFEDDECDLSLASSKMLNFRPIDQGRWKFSKARSRSYVEVEVV